VSRADGLSVWIAASVAAGDAPFGSAGPTGGGLSLDAAGIGLPKRGLVASRGVSTKEATPSLRAASGVLRVPDPRRAERADWAQLVRFCIVGASGYAINLGVFSLLTHGLGVHYIAAAVVAFCVAWASNFVWNEYWTFRCHALSAVQQGLRYLLVSLVALGLGLLVLHLLVVGGAPEVVAQALAIAAVTPISFLLNRRWSFR
jgi:putative flippase GtrA